MDKKNEILGTDLQLFEYFQGEDNSIERVDWRKRTSFQKKYFNLGSDLNVNNEDLEIIQGDFNLEQAILHRLRTIKGELFDTGHPDYGCDIYKMIGEPNTERNRAKIKMMVKDALIQESRIDEIVSIEEA